MSDSNNKHSSLAAISARHSLKRARVLYAVDPQSAFIPSTDPTILQASINRRKRRSSLPTTQTEGKQSDALAIVTENSGDPTLQMKPVASEASKISSALTIQGNGSTTESKKAGGILVVRLC